jgi:cell division protein FtsQ
MSKKMAVRKKSKQKNELLFNFVMPNFIKTIGKITLTLTVLGCIYLFFISVPILLPIKNISIEGSVNNIDKNELLTLLSKNNFNGMLSVDLEEIRMKVLENRWVKKVQIRKVWPDTLDFKFQEYKPVAKVNEMYLMESGKLIAHDDNESNDSQLMLLSIENIELNESNDYLGLLSMVNKMQSNLNRHKLNIFEFKILKNNNWHIQIEDRFLIKLGRKQQVERVEKLLQVYAAIENKKQIEIIDLRYSNGMAVKLFELNLDKKQNG